MGPDEKVYARWRATLQTHGSRRGLRLLVERFLKEPDSAAYPSPARWLWVLACRVVSPRGLALASLAAVPLVTWWALGDWRAVLLAASSPLLWILGRRQLQDGPIAALTLGAVGFALRGEPVGLALTLAALVACKEAAALVVPALTVAWLLSGHPVTPLAVAFAVAACLWALGTWLALGRVAIRVIRKALGGHDTTYTRHHQRGAMHRLWVDLVILSPGPVLIAAAGVDMLPVAATVAVTLITVHSCAPVRNVRFVLAADILIRAVAVMAISHPLTLAILVAWDVAIAWRLRAVYDPVTAALAHPLGMPHVHDHG